MRYTLENHDRHFGASLLLLVLALVIAACAGCKTTTFEHVSADGVKTVFKDRRLFTATGATYESTVNTNGTRTIRAAVQSSPQAEAIGAVAEGVARGLNP